MNALGDVLYEVSNALLWPVAAALLALLAAALFLLGSCIREGLERRRVLPHWRAFERALRTSGEEPHARGFFAVAEWPGLLARFALRGREASLAPRHLDALVADAEIEAARRLSRVAWVARTGPVLGLMGTLIPMGPALVALSQSDVQSLARSLVVAFTTTVVGLLIGLIASSIASVRRNWYAADVAGIEYLADCLGTDRSPE
jgi:biopolymer transport protein ExbB/TolQ